MNISAFVDFVLHLPHIISTLHNHFASVQVADAVI